MSTTLYSAIVTSKSFGGGGTTELLIWRGSTGIIKFTITKSVHKRKRKKYKQNNTTQKQKTEKKTTKKNKINGSKQSRHKSSGKNHLIFKTNNFKTNG